MSDVEHDDTPSAGRGGNESGDEDETQTQTQSEDDRDDSGDENNNGSQVEDGGSMNGASDGAASDQDDLQDHDKGHESERSGNDSDNEQQEYEEEIDDHGHAANVDEGHSTYHPASDAGDADTSEFVDPSDFEAENSTADGNGLRRCETRDSTYSDDGELPMHTAPPHVDSGFAEQERYDTNRPQFTEQLSQHPEDMRHGGVFRSDTDTTSSTVHSRSTRELSSSKLKSKGKLGFKISFGPKKEYKPRTGQLVRRKEPKQSSKDGSKKLDSISDSVKSSKTKITTRGSLRDWDTGISMSSSEFKPQKKRKDSKQYAESDRKHDGRAIESTRKRQGPQYFVDYESSGTDRNARQKDVGHKKRGRRIKTNVKHSSKLAQSTHRSDDKEAVLPHNGTQENSAVNSTDRSHNRESKRVRRSHHRESSRHTKSRHRNEGSGSTNKRGAVDRAHRSVPSRETSVGLGYESGRRNDRDTKRYDMPAKEAEPYSSRPNRVARDEKVHRKDELSGRKLRNQDREDYQREKLSTHFKEAPRPRPQSPSRGNANSRTRAIPNQYRRDDPEREQYHEVPSRSQESHARKKRDEPSSSRVKERYQSPSESVRYESVSSPLARQERSSRGLVTPIPSEDNNSERRGTEDEQVEQVQRRRPEEIPQPTKSRSGCTSSYRARNDARSRHQSPALFSTSGRSSTLGDSRHMSTQGSHSISNATLHTSKSSHGSHNESPHRSSRSTHTRGHDYRASSSPRRERGHRKHGEHQSSSHERSSRGTTDHQHDHSDRHTSSRSEHSSSRRRGGDKMEKE